MRGWDDEYSGGNKESFTKNFYRSANYRISTTVPLMVFVLSFSSW